MEKNGLKVIIIGVVIAAVSFLLFLHFFEHGEQLASSISDPQTPTTRNAVRENLSRTLPQSARALEPSVPTPSPAPLLAKQDDLQRRAEAAKVRADTAAAKAEAIFSKLAKYGPALNYSLAELKEEAAYPPGYQPGSDYKIEEARAARVEASATKIEALLTRQMRQ